MTLILNICSCLNLNGSYKTVTRTSHKSKCWPSAFLVAVFGPRPPGIAARACIPTLTRKESFPLLALPSINEMGNCQEKGWCQDIAAPAYLGTLSFSLCLEQPPPPCPNDGLFFLWDRCGNCAFLGNVTIPLSFPVVTMRPRDLKSNQFEQGRN